MFNSFEDGMFVRSVKEFGSLIISDKTTRNLSGFLMINFLFAFVELVYGLKTNSLSLISDAFHMFFDCTGLMTSLAASVISKWRPTEKFTYGYGRAEVIGSLINCLILLFIAFFVLVEAIERAIEPAEIKNERLLVVSVMGLLVNVVGILVFEHGSHHGKSHSHSHNCRKDIHSCGDPENLMDMSRKSKRSLINDGVLLHIMADTLGSVGVIVSSVLVEQFGWVRADTICSILIAFLITGSVIPLTKECIHILMQRQPQALDYLLPMCYQRVMQLVGVYRIKEAHFWTLHCEEYVGCIELDICREADAYFILTQTREILSEIGVRHVTIGLDYAIL